MLNFIKKNWYFFTVITLLLVTIILLFYTARLEHTTEEEMEEIEYIDSLNNYHKLYYESKFNDLKKENKQLYDSLKQYKDQVTYLIQFNAKHEYNTGKVSTSNNNGKVIDEVKTDSAIIARTFEYDNSPNDTMQYKLRINAEKEPNWYSLNIKTNNKYTIVNREYENNVNHVTIGDNTGGDISDVTVFKKKDKVKFIDRFAIGPSVGFGYDPFNKRLSSTVGVAITYDLKKRK